MKPTIDLGLIPKPKPKPTINIKVGAKKINTSAPYGDKPVFEATARRVHMERARARFEQRLKLQINVEPEVYEHEPNEQWHWLVEDEQRPSEEVLLLAKLTEPHAFRKAGITHMTTKCEHQLKALHRAQNTIKVLAQHGWSLTKGDS